MPRFAASVTGADPTKTVRAVCTAVQGTGVTELLGRVSSPLVSR